MSFKNDYMLKAINIAMQAFKNNEVPVGAIIVHDNKIIASTHNLTEVNFNPILHAEMIAISEASALLKTNKLVDCDMYVTLEPCPMCAQAISFARIRRLYFGAFDTKGGGVENGPRIFNSSSCHHKPEVYGGISEMECSKLLTNFFQTKRK
jgi:tRNA(adenine34) deaminase